MLESQFCLVKSGSFQRPVLLLHGPETLRYLAAWTEPTAATFVLCDSEQMGSAFLHLPLLFCEVGIVTRAPHSLNAKTWCHGHGPHFKRPV